MDSQHRHDLQQNDLRKITNQALPFFEKYGLPLVIGLAAVVVLGIGGVWWYSQSSLSTAESWTQLDTALHQANASADDFANVADRHPGSTAAAWAKLKEAEDYLKSGMQASFTDREASLADLKKAQAAFQKLEGGGTGVSPEIRERALFGLARCLESTSDGNTEDAIKVYSRLVTDFPDSMFKGISQDRITSLETSEAKEFYAWFHQQKPKPQDAHPFPFQKPAVKPTDEMEDADDESLDKDDAASTPEKPDAAETPSEAPGETKSDSETPADKPDASEKPSDSPATSETP